MTLTVTNTDKVTDHEWPEEAKLAFLELEKVCFQLPQPRKFGLICALAFVLEPNGIAVHFSHAASANPHMAQMCDDIADMFKEIAKRFRQ